MRSLVSNLRRTIFNVPHAIFFLGFVFFVSSATAQKQPPFEAVERTLIVGGRKLVVPAGYLIPSQMSIKNGESSGLTFSFPWHRSSTEILSILVKGLHFSSYRREISPKDRYERTKATFHEISKINNSFSEYSEYQIANFNVFIAGRSRPQPFHVCTYTGRADVHSYFRCIIHQRDQAAGAEVSRFDRIYGLIEIGDGDLSFEISMSGALIADFGSIVSKIETLISQWQS